jgi:hypothetical protein
MQGFLSVLRRIAQAQGAAQGVNPGIFAAASAPQAQGWVH